MTKLGFEKKIEELEQRLLEIINYINTLIQEMATELTRFAVEAFSYLLPTLSSSALSPVYAAKSVIYSSLKHKSTNPIRAPNH